MEKIRAIIILMACSAIMLGIGIFMFVGGIDSTSIVTGRFGGVAEWTISWQTPIFGAAVLLILAVLIKIDRPSLPKMDVQEKCANTESDIVPNLCGADVWRSGD